MPMDAPVDPYRELGLPRAASKADITNAYHHLVRLHHPDSRRHSAYVAESDMAALIRIMAAYAILADPQRRANYDQTRPAPAPRPHGPAPATPTWIGPSPPADLTVTPVRWHRGP